MNREILVSIGEVKIGRPGNILRVSLGTCVAIGVFWKEKSLFGLAHCLLPEGRVDPTDSPAKYVSGGLPYLMKRMGLTAADAKSVEAIIVGGASGLAVSGAPDSGNIGQLNAEAAQRLLRAAGIRISHVDVGSRISRQLVVDCQTGSFHVTHSSR